MIDGEEVKIPHMVIYKEDIISQFPEDEEEKVREIVKKLTKEQMITIANRVGDMMMEDYGFYVKTAFELEYEDKIKCEA